VGNKEFVTTLLRSFKVNTSFVKSQFTGQSSHYIIMPCGKQVIFSYALTTPPSVSSDNITMAATFLS